MGMSKQGSLDIGFTEVLYGVVVANAIYELTFSLELQNAILLLALAFIIGDWIEYQLSIDGIPWTSARYVKTLTLDVLILVTWYFLTIISIERLEWFFTVTAIFFLLQYLWDFVILGDARLRVNDSPEIHLTVVYASLAVFANFEVVPVLWLVFAAGVAFFVRKTPTWNRLLTEAEAKHSQNYNMKPSR